jgi:membrane-associated phospholipid phosphatase
MQSLAVMDTLSALKGEAGPLVSLQAPQGASAEAAAIAAAHHVLVELFPTEKAALDQRFADSLSHLSGHGIAAGQAFGDAVAAAVCAIRAQDGWDAQVAYQAPDQTNAWQPTPPAYANPLAPQWGQVDPFTLQSGDQFRPAEPPALDSQAYADAYNLTKDLGGKGSTARTADQTEIAKFWADGSGSYTPPGHWDAIAAQLASAQGYGLEASARLFATLNLALADAGIACWDAKYAYAAWRPITAIHSGDADGNDLTAADPTWAPLLGTPPFPEYTSGHSTFSAAAAAVLSQVFGEHVSFDTTSLTAPGVVRHYDSFEQAAQEAGMSRIYGGIHFMFSNLEGLACGQQVGQWVLDHVGQGGDHGGPSLVLTQKSGATLSTPDLHGFAVDDVTHLHLISVGLDGGTAKTVAVDDQGRFSLSLTGLFGAISNGDHHLLLSATDAAGHTTTTDWAFAWGQPAAAAMVASAHPGDQAADAGSDADLGGGVDLTLQRLLDHPHFHGQPFPEWLF